MAKKLIKSGQVNLFTNNQLIQNIYKKIYFTQKVLLIKNDYGKPELIAQTKDSDLPNYHAMIALLYMMINNKKSIKIIGGGILKKDATDLIELSEKSGSFGYLEQERLKIILENCEIRNEYILDSDLPFNRKETEYSYNQIINELHKVISED